MAPNPKSLQFEERGNHVVSAAVQEKSERDGTAAVPPVLRIAGLSKTFGATRALVDASLDIRPGEIHALMGSNGSGKSTLIKTLAGYHTPDRGAVAEFDGTRFDLGHAVPDNLRFVHQDLGLVLELNAMDNLALHGRLRSRSAGSRALGRPGARDPSRARALRRRSRHPPPARGRDARSSGRWSRSPRRCRAGTAAPACSSWTSRRRSFLTTRSSGCSPWSARSAPRARACSTSRTAWTRSSSWPIA